MRVETSKDANNPYRLVFVGQPEIEVVRTAFMEYVHAQESRGNTGSVSSFDRKVSNWWPYDIIDKDKQRLFKERAINTRDPLIVTDKLRELHENTDIVTAEMTGSMADVDDIEHYERRQAGVEWRYSLGNRALALAQVVELRVSEYMVEEPAATELDAVIARILAHKQLGP